MHGVRVKELLSSENNTKILQVLPVKVSSADVASAQNTSDGI